MGILKMFVTNLIFILLTHYIQFRARTLKVIISDWYGLTPFLY